MAEPKIIKEVNDLQSTSITIQPTPPTGVVPGRLWLDESDNTHQGTVLEGTEAHLNDNAKHVLPGEKELWTGDLAVSKLNKDAEGIFTVYEQRRADGTLAVKSTLSGGTTPQYTTRTIRYYGTDGTTVTKTVIRTLSYDADGILTSEV